jgi:hypothetical protein
MAKPRPKLGPRTLDAAYPMPADTTIEHERGLPTIRFAMEETRKAVRH